MAGFDSVEIHAGHGYLINQFLSGLWNKRSDEFGGTPENRARFCRMVIDEVRKAVGTDYPVLMRMSLDEIIPGGNAMEVSLRQMALLQNGVDLAEASVGGKYAMDAPERADGWRSAEIKASFKKAADLQKMPAAFHSESGKEPGNFPQENQP